MCLVTQLIGVGYTIIPVYRYKESIKTEKLEIEKKNYHYSLNNHHMEWVI